MVVLLLLSDKLKGFYAKMSVCWCHVLAREMFFFNGTTRPLQPSLSNTALLLYQKADALWLQPVALPPLISPHSLPVGVQTAAGSYKLGRLYRAFIQHSHNCAAAASGHVMLRLPSSSHFKILFIIGMVADSWSDVLHSLKLVFFFMLASGCNIQ